MSMLCSVRLLKRCATAACSGTLVALIASSSAFAQNAPSNQELFQMIQALQSQQQKLVDEAQRATAEASSAKAELVRTKVALKEAERKIASNKEEVEKARNDIAVADVKINTAIDGTAVAAASTSAGGQTVMGSQLSPQAVMVKTKPSGAYAAVAFKYLQDSTEDTPYAIKERVVGPGPDIVTRQDLLTADGEFSGAVDGIVGWSFGNGTDVRAKVSYYDLDDSSRIVNDGSLFILPTKKTDTIGTLGAIGDFARGSIDRQVISGLVEAGKTLAVGNDLNLRVSTGVQTAFIDSDFTTTYFEGFPLSTDPSFNESISEGNDIQAVGGRLGLEANWQMHSNFSAGISLGASLLYAQRDYTRNSRFLQIEDSGVISIDRPTKFSSDDEFVMPTFDMQATLTWHSMLGSQATSVTLGYDFQTWMNALQQYNGSRNETFSFDTVDLTLHGPFVQVGINLP